MTKKEKAAFCAAALKKEYPDALCQLETRTPFELLVAARLSAQCTDARVNVVTPALFERFPTAEAFAEADAGEVEELIRSCGFFHTKARELIEASKRIVSVYGGKIPDSMDDLLSLPGVGRKTANLILGDVYQKPAVVADTHMIRISNLLGLVSVKDPKKVEFELRELLDPAESNDFCHRCVLHGRAVCIARRPRCGQCVMNSFCDAFTDTR
ncbi:MAG: endonuclease III [Oscillospiraceae bacterium]|nr:endonuclease III [Oscillospiraceae bacterium]